MILNELINDVRLNLPIERKNQGYEECLISKIQDYQKVISEVEPLSFPNAEYVGCLKNIVSELSESVISTIIKNGSVLHGEAFHVMKEGIINSSNIYKQFTNSEKELLFVARLDSDKYYRIRKSDVELNKRKDLFHIPFTHREMISTQRFSVPGLPTLYLGATINECWRELGQPAMDRCYVTKVQTQEIINGDFLFVDIRNWIPIFRKRLPMNKEDFEILFQYLAIWPLIAACSVRRKFSDNNQYHFSPEYSIPQLLYQFVAQHKLPKSGKGFEGIIYSSSKRESWEYFDPKSDYSLAIPVKSLEKSAYSYELRLKYFLSEPINLGLIKPSNHEYFEGVTEIMRSAKNKLDKFPCSMV